jgi:TatD DNase family protein
MAVRPRWVDFHSHVDLYRDHAAVIAECDREKIATLAVTTTPKAWARNNELAAGSAMVRVALGLHPQLVAERAGELALFEKLLPSARYVGEIGLDAAPKFYSSFAEQERVFARILAACSEQGGKILTIHSVRTVAKVLSHLERSLPPGRGIAVLHWFTGTIAEAKRAAEIGCYFSVNSEMFRSQKNIALVRSLPINRILTETDGPFINVGNRPVRPPDVASTVQSLASALDMTPMETQARIITTLLELTKAYGG